MIVIIIFFVNFFSKWPLAAILDFTHFKKRSKLTKVHPADSESRHPGLYKSIVKNYIYKISRFGRKILFGHKELFFYITENLQ